MITGSKRALAVWSKCTCPAGPKSPCPGLCIVESPERFSGNPFASTVTFATNLPSTVPAPVAVIDALSHSILESMTFTGNPNDAPSTDATPGAFANIAHQGRAAGLAQTTGTVAFTFTPDSPGNGWQAMFSKEARNYVDGGHLSAWISNGGDLKVRYQSTDETVYLIDHHIELNPGQAHHFAFTFDGTSASLYIDGERRDAEDLSENPSFLLGMSGNTESLVFGASTTTRDTGELNHLNDFFDGTIENVVFVDRALAPVEVFKLAHGALEITPSVPTAAPLDITGTANPDTLNGDTGNDWIRGLGGNDILTGHAGDDAIYGGLDDDVIYAGAGDDTVFGGSGNNGIDGGTGDDTLYGGAIPIELMAAQTMIRFTVGAVTTTSPVAPATMPSTVAWTTMSFTQVPATTPFLGAPATMALTAVPVTTPCTGGAMPIELMAAQTMIRFTVGAVTTTSPVAPATMPSTVAWTTMSFTQVPATTPFLGDPATMALTAVPVAT